MKNMRHGFTMIELIFVIVIIGILAAVAIPKLSATRDDAKISTGAQNVATAITDIGAYYTANGSIGTNWTDMTAVKLDQTTGVSTAHYENGTTDCVTLAITSDGNLTVTTESNSTDVVCAGIGSRLISSGAGSDSGIVHSFGGSGVSY